MANKVKSIIFQTIIKLKTIELKVDAMLVTSASKNLLYLSTLGRLANISSTSRISLI